VYNGDWLNNKREGYGVLTTVNGEKYEGYFSNDIFNGISYLFLGQGSY